MNKVLIAVFLLMYSLSGSAQKREAVSASELWKAGVFPDTSLHSFSSISKQDAEVILENQVQLKDSIWKVVGGNWTFRCLYRTLVKDKETDMPFELYYDFENYKNEADAARFYSLIKSENAKGNSVSDLIKIGEEGFVLKDGLGNPFIMVRKGRGIYKLRTYKMKSAASSKELLKIAEQLVHGTI